MLRLAFEKAAQSRDPDLLHSAISAACGGDPSGREAEGTILVKLLRERPQVLRPVMDAYALALQRSEQLGRAQKFHEQLGHTRQAALCIVQEALRKHDAREREKCLRFARDLFNKIDAS